MTTQLVLALIGGILLLAVIVYGFRQGMSVRPDDRPDRSDGNLP